MGSYPIIYLKNIASNLNKTFLRVWSTFAPSPAPTRLLLPSGPLQGSPRAFRAPRSARPGSPRAWGSADGAGPGAAAVTPGRVQTPPPLPPIGPTPPRRPAGRGRGEAARRPRAPPGAARRPGRLRAAAQVERGMWAPGGPPGPAGWDRRRVGARLRAALAGLHELQGLRARQQARVWGALAVQPPPGPAAPRGPRAHELRLEAALAALQEQLVRSACGGRGAAPGARGRGDPVHPAGNRRTGQPTDRGAPSAISKDAARSRMRGTRRPEARG